MSWPPTELRRPGGGWCLDDADLARIEGDGPALESWLAQMGQHNAEALQLTAFEVPALVRQDVREPLGDEPLSAEAILKTVLLAVPLGEREALMSKGMLDLTLPAGRLRARVGPRGIQVRLDRVARAVAEPAAPTPAEAAELIVAAAVPSRGPAPLSFEGLSLADLPVVSESSSDLFVPEAEVIETHLTAPPPPVAPLSVEPALPAPTRSTAGNGPAVLRPRESGEPPAPAPVAPAVPVARPPVANRPPVLGGVRPKSSSAPPPVRPPELVHPDGSLAIEDADLAKLPDVGFTLAELLSVARQGRATRLELEGGMAPTAFVDGHQMPVPLPVLSSLQVYRLLLLALTVESRRSVLELGRLDGTLPHPEGPWRIFVRLDRAGLMVILEL